MPPRRRTGDTSEHLTPADLAALGEAVTAGRRATVYLREGTPSLGLEPGSSARVVSVDGTTVVVKPRGVDDELPYEADELRMTKNPPPRPEPTRRATKAKEKPSPAARPAQPRPSQQASKQQASPAPASTPATPPRPPVADRAPAAKPAARRASTKKGATSVTVTIHGSPDNEWSVSLVRGARKPQRARPVGVEAVEDAIRALGDTVAQETVASLMNAAREEAQRRVEELSAQLQKAQEQLAALERPGP